MSLHPPFPAAYDLFYNLGEALIMAKYASALVQIGFPLDQIGFIVSRHLDAQPFVLRCLLKQRLNLADEVLKKLAIGNEFDFQQKNLTTRDVIIRSGAEATRNPLEKELVVPRYNIIYGTRQPGKNKLGTTTGEIDNWGRQLGTTTGEIDVV